MFAVPVAAAVAAGLAVLRLLEAVAPALAAESLALLVVGAVTLLVFGAVGPRAMTLAALLDISMRFPYQAGSRLSIALRTGSHLQLLEALRRARETAAWADAPAALREAAVRLDRVENVLTLVAVLSTLEHGTRDHSERVGRLTDRIAGELGLDPEAREKARWAALLHDIGKLTVPRQILDKPGPLSADEWSVIYQHPIAGARIVAPLDGWLGDAARAVLEHHERWDGSGYPLNLAGKQISMAARIVAVADSYEVMTSARVYKRRMATAAARQELARNAGGQFDADVVAAFLAITSPADGRGRRLRHLARRLPVVAVAGARSALTPVAAAAMVLAAAVVVAAATLGPSLIASP
jgi:putative nucleotidyltransferase with HDIG domain